jgi:hypothetical protein
MTEFSLEQIFSESSYLLLTGLLAAGLFFLIAGLREIKDSSLQGLLLIALSAFFACAHALYLINIPTGSFMAKAVGCLSLWQWLAVLFAPALVALFLSRGLLFLIMTYFRAGLVRVFFGLTLVFFLYIVGLQWPVDIKGILVVLWAFSLLEVELGTA